MVRIKLIVPLGLVAAACGDYDSPPEPAPKDARPAVQPDIAPPPVSGGTLAVSEDGTLAVAADSDRDRVLVVDLASKSVRGSIDLAARDEPGRVVLDGATRAYVALRGGGAVVAIDLAQPRVEKRMEVCSNPRGLALDSDSELLHVACAGGDLVSVSTLDGQVVRVVEVGFDLRDVVVTSDGLMVSRFRAAEIVQIDTEGNVVGSVFPTSATHLVLREVEGDDFATQEEVEQALTPSVAWRMISNGEGGVLVLHQRGVQSAIELPDDDRDAVAGYAGGPLGCSSIVHTAVTEFTAEGEQLTSRPIAGLTLGVDIATGPRSGRFLIAQAGLVDAGAPGRSDEEGGPITPDLMGPLKLLEGLELRPVNEAPGFMHDCAMGSLGAPTESPVVSVAFTPDDVFVAQTRQPSQLIMANSLSGTAPSVIDLGGASVYDTGHELFHRDSGGGIACASCHPEGREDGRVWDFVNVGKRRTQPLDVGLAGTQPFHWSGDLPTLSNLVDEVFVKRMGGAAQSQARLDTLEHWLFALRPLAPLLPSEDPSVVRGRELFESPETECSTCHDGRQLTHQGSFQVRELSEALQVPSLIGIGHRAPFMHDGCAPTLEDRFDPTCGGGDLHGKTAQLSDVERADLVSYMLSL